MKMAKNKMRFLAGLLAIVTVLAIIPAAAVSAAVNSVTAQDYGVAVNGSTLAINYDAGTSESFYSVTMSNVKTHYAAYTVNNIDDLIVSDYDVTPEAAASLTSSNVSVYETTAATYTASNVQNSLNTTLAGKVSTGEAFTQVTSFSSSFKNKLTTASVYYSGTTTKTVYLYAKVTPYTYTFQPNVTYVSGVAGTTTYVKLGYVTLYSSYNSSTLKVQADCYGSLSAGESVTLIASVANATGSYYKYNVTATAATAPGIATIKALNSEGSIYQITGNGLVNYSNLVTVTAYQMYDAALTKYLHRASNGLEIGLDALHTGGYKYSDGYTYYPVYGTTTTYLTSQATATLATGLKFSQSLYSLQVSESATTSVSATTTGSVGSLRYASGNTAVAVVSSSGVITAVGEGTTYITASNSVGAIATTYVTVSPLTAIVSVSKPALSIKADETATLTASILTVSTNKSLVWSSSDTSIVTVDANGKVTAKKEGSAVITVASAAYPTRYAVCYVNVQKADAKITLKETMTLEIGATDTLDATITDDSTLLYVSDNTAVAKVDAKGKVTAVDEGITMITVMSAADSSVKAYCVVTVEGGEKGVVERESYYSTKSKYYLIKAISSGEVKSAIAELKGEDEINVVIDVTSKSDKTRVSFTRYAMARLSKYADSLTVRVNGVSYIFDADDLELMTKGYPAYFYVTPEKLMFKYKNDSGVYKTIKGVEVEVEE